MVGLFPVVSLILVAVVAPMSATDDQFVYLFECADPKLKKDHPFIHCEDLVDEDDRDFLNEKNACGAKSDNEDDWYCWEDDYEPRDLYHSIAGIKKKTFAANCARLNWSWFNPDCNYMRCTKKSANVDNSFCGALSAADVLTQEERDWWECRLGQYKDECGENDDFKNYPFDDYLCWQDDSCARDYYCLRTHTCSHQGSLTHRHSSSRPWYTMFCVKRQERVASEGLEFSTDEEREKGKRFEIDEEGNQECYWSNYEEV